MISTISGFRRSLTAKCSQPNPAMKAAEKLAADLRRFRELVNRLCAQERAAPIREV
jgi:hypothetical protein